MRYIINTVLVLLSPWHKLNATYSSGYNRCETSFAWPTKEAAAALAGLAVGAAALVLVVLTTGSFEDLIGPAPSRGSVVPKDGDTSWQFEFFKFLLALCGFFLLLGAGTVIDWFMDQMGGEQWKKLFGEQRQTADPEMASAPSMQAPGRRPWRIFRREEVERDVSVEWLARSLIFGGAYFFVSLALSVLTFVMVWISLDHFLKLERFPIILGHSLS